MIASEPAAAARGHGGRRLAGLALGLVAVGIGGAVFRWDRTLAAWTVGLREAGAPGLLGFVALYVAATVLALPGAILTIAAGWLYGPWLGTALVSPASVLGATIAFALGRTVARDWVAARVAGRPMLAAVEAAVAERPFTLVLLLRLSPVFPFNALNYGLGLTPVPWRAYVAGSFLGMLPGTLLYVFLGSSAGSAAAIAGGAVTMPPAGRLALWSVGLAVTLAVVVVVTRLARRELRRALADASEPPAPVVAAATEVTP